MRPSPFWPPLLSAQPDPPSAHAGETPSKRSKIEKETNFNVLVNFAILMILCTACAVADGVYSSTNGTSADLYEQGADVSSYAVIDALVTFG